MFTLSIAYSIAWRTFSFAVGPLIMLKTRYGLLMWPAKIAKFGSFLASSVGIWSVGTGRSHIRAPEPARRSCSAPPRAFGPSGAGLLPADWWLTGAWGVFHRGVPARRVGL